MGYNRLSAEPFLDVVAPGTINFGLSSLEIVAPTEASVAQILFSSGVQDDNYLNSIRFLDKADGVEVVIRGGVSGNDSVMIALDYYLGESSSVGTLKCYFNTSFGTQKFYFPVLSGSDNARIRIGADDTGTIGGIFNLEDVGISLLNANNQDIATGTQVVAQSLVNMGVGAWAPEYFSPTTPYHTSNMRDFNVTSDYIQFDLEENLVGYPQIMAQFTRQLLANQATQIPYFAEVVEISNTFTDKYIRVAIYDVATGNRVDPLTINSESSLSILGSFIK